MDGTGLQLLYITKTNFRPMQQVDWFTRLHLQLHETDRSGLWFIANYNGEMDGKYSTCAKQILPKKDLSYFLQCVGFAPCRRHTANICCLDCLSTRMSRKEENWHCRQGLGMEDVKCLLAGLQRSTREGDCGEEREKNCGVYTVASFVPYSSVSERTKPF